MTAKVLALRPRPRPRPGRRPAGSTRPASPISSLAGPVEVVSVDWSPERGAYVAACARCTETALPVTLDSAEQWADTHVCDSELVALLDQVCGGSAA